MNRILVSLLLGVTVFSLHIAALEELAVSVWPPGSKVYLGESVLMHCRVSNLTFSWTYHWYRNKPRSLNQRPLVYSDSYSITAVTREDAGIYWCKAEQSGSNITTEGEVELSVTDLPPPSLTVTPSSRQIFSGDHFTVQCPPRTDSTGWKLTRVSQSASDGLPVKHTETCSPQGGAVDSYKSDTCVLTADSGNGGLYWCEGSGGRSRSVNITVSYGNIILKTPVFPVHRGDKVVLKCLYRTNNSNKTTFYKNGKVINTFTSENVKNLTLENVTQTDEGFYKCASWNRKLESPESWLSVIPDPGNFTSKDGTATSDSDLWKWMIVSFIIVLLFLTPLTVWLVLRNRYWTFHTQSCWPFSKEDVPAVPLPATKQDVTEVQWDLSWMEMSSLLDKQLYPGT